MAKAYVSSTFEDLRECRDKVRLVLQQLGHVDVAMETYVAGPERPLEKCLADVAACDLYIGIFGWRYGHVPRGQDRSITELEYRAAVEHHTDCLIFLLDEDAPWPPKYVDDDKRCIRRLRGELSEDQLCSSFGTSDQLASLVNSAIANWSAGRAVVLPGSQELSPSVVAAYAQRLQQRYGRLDLDALTPAEREEYLQIQLRAVFVEPSVREDPPPVELPKELWEKLEAEGEIRQEDLPAGFDLTSLQKAQAAYQGRPLRRVLDVLAEDAGQHAVVLGDPGAGKSTLARYLALSLLEADPDSRIGILQGYLPLLVELRTYARVRAEGRAETFVEFLAYLAEAEGYPFSAGQLEAFLQSGSRALVIFDGLDELFDPADREMAAERIAGFAARYPATRILVTSRIVGYRRGILTNSGFEHYTLQDLSDKQIGDFLATWYGLAFHGRGQDAGERRQRLLKAMTDSRSIRELAGNPMLLTILAIIGKGQELPRERWKLYDHAATVLVHHWDVNKHLRDERVEADFIGEDDRKELLRRVANRMQAGAAGLAGNHLPADQLQAEFESYLRDRYQRDRASAKIIAAAMIRQFRERNFILSRYGASVYGFVHRAFLEFFCADYYVQQFEKLQELSIAQLKQQVFAAHWADPSWREVLRLITGRIADRFAGEVIRFLARDVYQPWPQQFGDRPPRNIALAVQCLGEVHSPNAIRGEAVQLLRVIIALLEHAIGAQDRPRDVMLEEELVPAIQTVGMAWPGRELYQQWYQQVGASYTQVPVSNVAAQIAGILLPDSQGLRETLNRLARTGDDYRKRTAAVMGIAEGWGSDPGAQALLHDLSRNDNHRMVRQTAMIATRDRWPTAAETFSLLGDRATKDPAKDVRQAALLAVGDGWPGDDRVLAILCEVALHESDPDVKEAARRRLRADPAARGFLLNRSTSHADVNTRRESVTLIAAIWPGDPEVFTLVLGRASDEAAGVRLAAVTALGGSWADRPETLTLLRDRATDPHSQVRRAAVAVLGGSWADRPETLTLLRDRASDQDAGVRLVAVTALGGSWADRPETLTLLRGRASDRAADVRLAAVTALGNSRADDPETLTLLRDRATGSDWRVRRAAVTALGNSRADDPKTLTLLRGRAGDEAADVRRAAVTALGNSRAGDPETFTLRRDRATGPDAVARRAAVTALGNSRAGDPETFTLLRDLATGPDAVARLAAVTALGNGWAGDPETFTLLRDLAGDQDAGVRLAAVTALGNGWAGDPETFTLLRDLAGDQDAGVRRAAVTALGNGWAGGVRRAAVTALGNGWAGDPETFTLLRDLAGDQDAGVRRAAVTALGNGWAGDPETLRLLRRQASRDQDLSVRQAATRAILQSAAKDPRIS